MHNGMHSDDGACGWMAKEKGFAEGPSKNGNSSNNSNTSNGNKSNNRSNSDK